MENAEEIQLVLERYARLKPKEIPEELEEYMGFVAKTGDTVFKWPLIQHLFREKLMNVITEFHDSSPSITDLPHYPNVDPFNFDLMKKNLIERMESFHSAPFTIQRICELLTQPRQQYSRLDKFMRAIEKNILVVSTTEPGRTRHESENGESLDSTVNGDLMSEGNLDVGSSEEEQNVTENLPVAEEGSNGTTGEQPDPTSTTVDPLSVVDNPEIDVPLEKLVPEVNVHETNMTLFDDLERPITDKTKTIDDDAAAVDNAQEPAVSTEISQESEANPVISETKTDENIGSTTPSPAKRLIEEETEIPIDESVSKKVKIDDEKNTEANANEKTVIGESSVVVEIIPEIISTEITPVTDSNPETSPLTTETPSEQIVAQLPDQSQQNNEPIIDTVATETIVGVVEVLPDDSQASLLLAETTTTIAASEIIEQDAIQPLPPIETIGQETNMEQQIVGISTATEDEDLMKVDSAPLTNSENNMQTDEVEETTASAMDVDECSADFIME